MPTSRTLLVRTDAMDTQTRTRLAQFPDIPGIVVEIRRIQYNLTSFSSATAVAIVLHHNVELGITLSTSDFTAAWAAIEAGASGGTPSFGPVVFEVPYELIGPQRVDYQLSAGTGDGVIMFIYTTRRERNKTVWNELRARTSFEKG